MKKMFKKILIAIGVIIVLSGAVMLLFAPVSNQIGKIIANDKIEQFEENAKNFEKDEELSENIKRLRKDSLAYNENLKENQNALLVEAYSYQQPAFDLTEYGINDNIYGYVTAPSIDLNLPIYLGANDSAMSYGAAHLTYTSLPTGGESTNVALAGHTGYVGRVFFDNIFKLKIGDEINVRNYWTTLSYKVKETKIVPPFQSENVYISEGKNLLTLITCISDGKGGFNRYLVICEAVK